MKIMMTATIYNPAGESRIMPQAQAEHLIRQQPDEWSFAKPSPAGWDTEIPRYRAQFDLEPAALPRYLHENPFNFQSDSRSWQYSAKKIKAGEVIETTSWPHPSLIAQNETAKRIHAYFMSAMRSRMQISPWKDGRLNLDNGMSFGKIKIATPGFEPAERASNQQGSRRTATRRG